MKRRWPWIAGGVLVLVGGAWALLATRYDVITFQALGPEMWPNFGKGARLLVDKRRTPARGDVVVIRSKDVGGWALRRVVALPGDRYAFKDTRPVVDGKQPEWTDLGYAIIDKRETREKRESTPFGRTYLVFDDVNRHMRDVAEKPPLEGYWLLDDNRDYLLAKDSRMLGTVPRAEIRGVVTWVLQAGDLPYVRPQQEADAGPPLPRIDMSTAPDTDAAPGDAATADAGAR